MTCVVRHLTTNFMVKCFVFFVECELHQTNCEYSLFPIIPYSCDCISIKVNNLMNIILNRVQQVEHRVFVLRS